MPTKKARLQVILPDDAIEHVKELAEDRGLSVSSMCCQLIRAALKNPEFRRPEDLAKIKSQVVQGAIDGVNISHFRLAKLVEIVSQIERMEAEQ